MFSVCFPLAVVVSGLPFRSSVHFELLVCVWWWTVMWFYVLHIAAQFPQHFLLKRLAQPCLPGHASIDRECTGLLLGFPFCSARRHFCFYASPLLVCFLIYLFNWRLITLQYCSGFAYIDMNQPWVYMCSPSWTPLPPPSPSHPSGSSQCTSPD